MPISAQHTKFEYPDYISPLPAEDLLKFAEKKQQMYDEGVSKIQQSLDTYNNLRSSILTDVEKEYFDKSMGNLVKSISNSAGLDFSNKANVQAVLSVGKPLERDNNILTAISNGKEVSRRQEELSKMKPEARSAANDSDYFEDVQDYMKSGKLGYKLGTKEYTPFVDVSAKVQDMMKGAKENGYLEEYSDGQYIRTVSVKGLSEQEIAAKVRATLGAKEQNQLRIDAMYDVKQKGIESAHEDVVNYYSALDASTQAGLNLSSQKVKEAQSAFDRSGTASAKKVLEQTKQQYEQFRVQSNIVKDNLNKISDINNFNPNQYVAIYQDKFISQQANAYAYRQEERKMQADPYGTQAQAFRNAKEMAFLNADLERKTAEAIIPKGSKILSNVDQFNITQDVKNTLGAMKDAYGKRTLNLTVNNQTTSSTVGAEIQKIDELLKSNDPNKLKQVIEKATTLTNKGFIEGTDAEFLKAIVNKATGLKRSYDKYLSLGTSTSANGETTFSENPNIMVNNGSQTLPASQYFNLPLSVLLDDSDQTVIYEYKEPSI
jgi:hypothetical protein